MCDLVPVRRNLGINLGLPYTLLSLFSVASWSLLSFAYQRFSTRARSSLDSFDDGDDTVPCAHSKYGLLHIRNSGGERLFAGVTKEGLK